MRLFSLNLGSMQFYRKWLILGVLIGIAAGVGSLTFYYMLNFFQTMFLVHFAGATIPYPVGEGGTSTFVLSFGNPYLILISLVLGGLLAGFIVYKFAPEAEGHGTDAAIDSFHNKQGRISRRVPIVKTIASALTIGSGGSAGREGPTAQISAGIGSWLSDVFKLSDQDRRTAVLVGIGAGVGTIFKAPIGGALLAVEIPYKADLEVQAIFPAIVASAIGYSIFGAVVGFQPIFGYYLGAFAVDSLPLYVALGVITGLAAIAYVRIFYYMSDKFKELKVSRYFKPAIGAFFVGIIALAFPEVLSTGYGWVQLMINNNLSAFPTFGLPILAILLLLVLAKILATSFTIGSGGSGGVFGPGMFIGATIGTMVGIIFNMFVPGIAPSIAPFAIIGMLAFFGGAAKVPLAMLLMVTEMTGSVQILPAAMIAVVIAYVVTGNETIYKSQLNARKGSVVAQSQRLGSMNILHVGVKKTDSVDYVRSKLQKFGLRSMPVIQRGRVIGSVSKEDIGRLKNESNISKAMKKYSYSLSVNDGVGDAVEIMVRRKMGWISVEKDGKYEGIVTLKDIVKSYEKSIKEKIT